MDVVFWNGGIATWENSIVSRSIGPYKIAHWLRKRNYECQVIDHITKLSENELLAATKKFVTKRTLALALSTTFLCGNQYDHSDGSKQCIPEHALNVLRQVRQDYPSVKIVVGGYRSDHVPNWGVVDATVMSYTKASEDIFLEYVNHLMHGTQEPVGSMIRMSDGFRMVYDRAREPVYAIEQDDFRFVRQDIVLPKESLPLDVSRGCIFACKFCQFAHLGKGKLDYIRSMDLIEEELAYNYETFGTTSYYVLDDTFNDTEWKVREFHKMSQRLPFKIDYAAYVRADLLHRYPDTPHLLKESGMFGAFHGIETFHPSASKIIGKGWSGKHAKDYIPRLFHDIWKGEITQNLSFIVGLPDDTEDNVTDTVQWFLQNDLHNIQINPLWLPGPGNSQHTILSEFEKDAAKYGFTFAEDGWEKNNNWTRERACHVAKMASQAVSQKTKITMWLSVAMLQYGYERAMVLRTPNKELPWHEIKTRTARLYRDYYERLMGYQPTVTMETMSSGET